jgi:hypothetical protein
MNKQLSIRLLEETFGQDYDRSRFCKFIKELFNRFEVNERKWSVWPQYEEFIQGYTSLGTFHDENDKIIEVLEVKLKKTSSRDRARTMQRNFIATFLKKYFKEAAIVAFFDETSDWRFSFVKMDYNIVRDEEGKVKITEELTPVKRYSYLVGSNEPNHTCKKQFLDIIKNEGSNPLVSDIENAFSIDNVTKEFFEKYKGLVLDLKESINKVISNDNRIDNEFEKKGIKAIDFAKKLLGQIVFIYFLQKKGWLGVKKDEDWGTGPRNFLRKLFGDKQNGIQPIVKYDNFFNEILEPLFYDALANPRYGDDGYYVHFNCKIPFLNGGLFEPINDYDWAGTDIKIDNSIFENIFETFDRYNFTIKEDEPLEKEVAVDPEMLGKVFENLIEVKERKDKGAFYTPREIVHYMCQQSLINYLETNTEISRKDIETFIQYGELSLEHAIADLEYQKNGKSYVDKNNLMPKSIIGNFRRIDRLLKDIKIVDPAVGSGAFPVGMMNEIVKARSILTIYFQENEQIERTNYNFKRQTIENSLYGVDIDQSAVEIAKLRFWLSLIVDEREISKIKPLPNLDHKIMCGNSLLEEFEGIKLFDEKLLGSFKEDKKHKIQGINEQIIDLKAQLSRSKSISDRVEIDNKINKLKKKINDISRQSGTDQLSLLETESDKKIKKLKSLQNKYFNEQNQNIKKDIRVQIDNIEWELIEATLKEQNHEDALEKLNKYKKIKVKPFFLWKLYFAEIFQRDNPGFDIVIANPPYVSYGLRNVGKLSKEDKQVIRRTFPNSAEYKISLYALFMDKSINLSRVNGVQSLIVPDSFLLGRYFSKIRNYILNNNRIDSILLFTNKVFDATVGFSVVYVFQKGSRKNNKFFCSLIENESDLINKRGYCYSQSYFTNTPYNRFRLFFNEKTMKLVKHIEGDSEILGNYLTGHTGVRSLIGQKKIISKNCNGPTWKKGLISGSQIGRYWLKYEGDYLNIDPNLLNKGGWDPNVILNKKIMVRQTGDQIYATIDQEKYYHLNNIHSFNKKNDHLALEYILAILNSSMLNTYYQLITLEKGRTMAQTDIETLELLPIKEISNNQQTPLIKLVNQILDITKNDDYLDNSQKQTQVKKIEKKIDMIVYNLYGLTDDEIKIVEEINENKNRM